jgi:hypothetical protein
MTDELSRDPRIDAGKFRVRVKRRYMKIELWGPSDMPFKSAELAGPLTDKEQVLQFLRGVLEALEGQR